MKNDVPSFRSTLGLKCPVMVFHLQTLQLWTTAYGYTLLGVKESLYESKDITRDPRRVVIPVSLPSLLYFRDKHLL